MIPKSVPIKDERMFRMAMRHVSATNDPIHESYERLEYLGDAVLGLIIAQYLYENHPDWDQGIMSKARSSVVQEITLSEAALRMGLEQYIELSANEEQMGGRTRPAVLCDIFEAVIGAIYLESGFEKARWFALEQLQPYLRRVSTGDVNPHDFKSKLQETAQAIWRISPTYKVAAEKGAAHDRRFTVTVVFDNEVIGTGHGRSKKEAEQDAARDALEAIHRAQRAREMAQQSHLE
ncbi:MAG: ribonuclease III [Fimbriimonadaceae bacterium]|nr:ribonuclease III [Fimbriimonadaceae bacterium]